MESQTVMPFIIQLQAYWQAYKTSYECILNYIEKHFYNRLLLVDSFRPKQKKKLIPQEKNHFDCVNITDFKKRKYSWSDGR